MKEREPGKPDMLSEEERHNRYSVDSAMNHYKNNVYYRQRRGGTDWFHGRVSSAYRANYDRIFRGKDKI